MNRFLEEPNFKFYHGDILKIVSESNERFTFSVMELGLDWLGGQTHRRLYNRQPLQEHLQNGGFEKIEVMEFDGDNGIRAVASKRVS